VTNLLDRTNNPDKISFMEIKDRILHIDLPPNKSAFLWGPRKVGKSYWIQHHLQQSIFLDLVKSVVFAEYVSRAS
jgi:hypothetical protein